MDRTGSKRAAANEARRQKRKSRGQGLRKTTGCTTCKRRHLKCDESFPECGQCVKSKRACLYRTRAHRSPSCVSNSGDVLSQHEPSTLRIPESSIGENSDQTDEVTTRPILDTSATAQTYISDEPNCTYCPAPTPPDAAFYRWFGLLADDVVAPNEDSGPLIDHTTPLDLGTAQNIESPQTVKGLSLQTFRQRYAIPSNFAHCLSSTTSSGTVSRDTWHGSLPKDLTDSERRLFHNFVNSISSWIDIYDPQKHFSVLVPHLAMHDAGLMTAILALSAQQLSISPDASLAERDRNVGLQYYYETLHYLQKAMSAEAYTVSLELLATALIVSMYEMLDDSGSGSGWERHLKGVFWIQRSQLIQGETGGLKSAVWWAWLRQDIWAAFRERRKTLSFWTPTKALADLSSYELAARVIWLFARAVDYCSEEEVACGKIDPKMRVERADTILDMLHDWKTSLPQEFEPLPIMETASFPGTIEPLWIHPPAFSVSMQLHHASHILVLLQKPSNGGIQGFLEQLNLLTTFATNICRLAMTNTDPASALISI